MSKSINLYLKDKGITVEGNTDKYYRLSPDGIKAWYVDVPEPTKEELEAYEQKAVEVDKLEKAEREVQQRKQLAEEKNKKDQLIKDAAKMEGASQVLKDEAKKLTGEPR